MSDLETVERLANSYNDKAWEEFFVFYDCVKLKEDEFSEVPKDIARVIVGMLGKEQANEWVKKPLQRLDNQKVIDLIKNEKGVIALKVFLLSMRV